LLLQWWNSGLAETSTASKSRQATIRIYTAWNIWKERNRRIFESTTSTPRRVLQLIKDEMALRSSALCFGSASSSFLMLHLFMSSEFSMLYVIQTM
jgi:hypothetical protein